jgi:Nucleotidyltransferase domain
MLPPTAVRLGPPCRRPILIATIYLLFQGRDTGTSGSYARGTARTDSDVDLGLCYSEQSRSDIESIRGCLKNFSMPASVPTVTSFYEWGPWVNGGAWVQTTAANWTYCTAISIKRLQGVLALPMGNQRELETAVHQMHVLWREAVDLTEGHYTPKLDLSLATPARRPADPPTRFF